MKAKIKSTQKEGGVPITLSLEERDISDDRKILNALFGIKEPDWEQMRHDMAKDFTATLLGRLNYDPFTANACCCCSDSEPINPYSHIARIAVSVADALIEELKKPKNQVNDV